MTTPATATTFRAAADVIRANGFTQNSYEHDGAYCIVGALVRGAGYSNDPFDHVRAVRAEVEILADLIGDPADDTVNGSETPFLIVTDWNDEEGRTPDQVIELLDRAANHIDPPRGPA